MIAIKPEHDNFHFETRKLKQKGIGLGLYSGLENSMDHRVPRVTKNWTTKNWLPYSEVIFIYVIFIGYLNLCMYNYIHTSVCDIQGFA